MIRAGLCAPKNSAKALFTLGQSSICATKIFTLRTLSGELLEAVRITFYFFQAAGGLLFNAVEHGLTCCIGRNLARHKDKTVVYGGR